LLIVVQQSVIYLKERKDNGTTVLLDCSLRRAIFSFTSFSPSLVSSPDLGDDPTVDLLGVPSCSHPSEGV